MNFNEWYNNQLAVKRGSGSVPDDWTPNQEEINKMVEDYGKLAGDEVGKPNYFNFSAYLETINGFINSDEIEIALYLMDRPPAWYRDNPPKELTEMRERLHKQLWTPIQYCGIYDSLEEGKAYNGKWPLRAKILEDEIKYFNCQAKAVEIMELAPGSDWIYQGLNTKGLDFSYRSVSLDGPRSFNENPYFGDTKRIFVAFEIIEHLHNEWEIYQNYLKFGEEADVVMVSTPRYCYAGGMPDWQNRELGHLRAYTPPEFHSIVSKMFKGYEWSMMMDDTMVLVGKR